MKILVVKTSALGDIIHAFPSLSYLYNRFPNAQIDWVVEKSYSGLLKTHPWINRTLCVDTKKWRKAFFGKEMQQFRQDLRSEKYDVVFDLQGNIKSAFITFQARGVAKVGFGWKSVPEWPNTFFTRYRYNPPRGQNIRDDYLHIVKAFFQDSDPYTDHAILLDSKLEIALPNKKTVMVCPGSAWRNKQLPPETLRAFLTKVQTHLDCYFFFVWGSNKEQEIAQKLHATFASQLVDKLSLPDLQNLMDKMDYVIAMDSLPLHLAGTTSTPTFSVFGPSSAAKYQPKGNHHHAFQGTCPYGRTFEKRCPILRTCPTGACMRDLTSDALFDAFISNVQS